MILLAAVLVGLTAGICRALIGKRKYRVYDLNATGLVLLAFIPQFIIFFFPATRSQISHNTASILYVCSLIVLIVFSLFNIRKISFWPIAAGFLLNALVILLNGGWMPISPAMVEKLTVGTPQVTWQVGERLAYSKDIVLAPEATRLWLLSDRFTLPDWINYQVAFSLGDILIFVGVLWLLWSLGGKEGETNKEKQNE